MAISLHTLQNCPEQEQSEYVTLQLCSLRVDLVSFLLRHLAWHAAGYDLLLLVRRKMHVLITKQFYIFLQSSVENSNSVMTAAQDMTHIGHRLANFDQSYILSLTLIILLSFCFTFKNTKIEK